MNVIAGIITYNPELDRLKLNIEHIIGQVNEVIIFDNGSKNINYISHICELYDTVTLIKSPDNLGIATALNRILQYCYSVQCKWLLTLDQDTICPHDIIMCYEKYSNYDNAALLCAKLVDKRKTIYNDKLKNESAFEEIEVCETSGTLMNLELCKNIGGFEDILFIDYVDFEYCTRLRANEYKILRINTVVLEQEFGVVVPSKYSSFYIKLSQTTKIKFISKLSYKSIYNPLRRYYCMRNRIYYLRKYCKYLNIPIEILKTVQICTRTLLRGQNKLKLFKALIKGLIDGIEMDVSVYKKIRN